MEKVGLRLIYMSLTLGTISISATEIKMIPSPLSMLLLKETGKISHTMAGDDFPDENTEGEEVLTV